MTLSRPTSCWSVRVSVFAALLLALLCSSACTKKRPAPKTPFTPKPGWTETGIASWYGHPYHGRRAANGEVYDMEQFTAAHRTLPFGAVLLVTSLANNKQVEVRITDRGPFIDGRIIDLSRAAARSIDMLGPGTARVRIKLTAYTAARQFPGTGAFSVQVGAFTDRGNADNLFRQLSRQYDPVQVVHREGSSAPWRVLVGRKDDQGDADSLAVALRQEFKDVFVVRLD